MFPAALGRVSFGYSRCNRRQINFHLSDRLRMWSKTFSYSVDHHEEPIEVETVESKIACKIGGGKPRLHSGSISCECHHNRAPRCVGGMEIDSSIHVPDHANRRICSVDQSARKKAQEKDTAIVKLQTRACHVDLVHKPMYIQEWCGKLPENEDTSVVVQKWAL